MVPVTTLLSVGQYLQIKRGQYLGSVGQG